ncbi:hypothetical protein [Winogradskyella helgolandensis]|uniref:hypothetical protein n=1 Tax=Winogradskyella helgolandensis TaxID=2697010 RepID=UPI0015BD642C|nr:hypothetical protein [Winogradskyella helgolandensis]
MKETIPKNEKSLHILNKLIQNGHYNGYIELEKFELTRNYFPNNYFIIGTLNADRKFEIKSYLKIRKILKDKFLALIGIALSLFSFIHLKSYWLVLIISALLLLLIYFITKIKKKKEIKIFTTKFLDIYKMECD